VLSSPGLPATITRLRFTWKDTEQVNQFTRHDIRLPTVLGRDPKLFSRGLDDRIDEIAPAFRELSGHLHKKDGALNVALVNLLISLVDRA